MPLSHRLSRALLSIAILGVVAGGLYLAHRHGATAWTVHLTRQFATSVRHTWGNR